jgi:hypothetical protein
MAGRRCCFSAGLGSKGSRGCRANILVLKIGPACIILLGVCAISSILVILSLLWVNHQLVILLLCKIYRILTPLIVSMLSFLIFQTLIKIINLNRIYKLTITILN